MGESPISARTVPRRAASKKARLPWLFGRVEAKLCGNAVRWPRELKDALVTVHSVAVCVRQITPVPMTLVSTGEVRSRLMRGM